ncbi:MAG: hypothetical protein PHW62_01265 [Candidatus Ratteibacteria bacterium]|nr:hypothetical protein [Candidatus Ratteibacteria bacterium]
MKKIIWIIVFALFICSTAMAKDAKDIKKEENAANQKIVLKEVQGEVTWIRNDKIAIMYAQDNEAGTAEEMLLPVPEDVSVINKKSLNEIKVGDIVRVQYEEVTEETPEGTSINSRAKTIIFLKAAVKKPVKPPPEEEEEEILDSGEE